MAIAAWHPFKTRRRVADLVRYVLVAEHWIYGLIVDGVVLMVRVCSENWRQVHCVGAKVLQVVKMINDAAKVSTKKVAAAGGLLIPAGVPSIAVYAARRLRQILAPADWPKQ